MTGGVAPGWYPDYEAPPGHERYWDGQAWTERRGPQRRPRRWWPWVVLAALVGLGVVVLGTLGLFSSGDQGPADVAPPEPAPGTSEVASVVDGTTIELDDGVLVRLDGLASSCSSGQLARLVQGRRVALVGDADADPDGRLPRYVERDGLDVGLRLIQRGFARAATEPHPRGAQYRRVDARSEDAC